MSQEIENESGPTGRVGGNDVSPAVVSGRTQGPNSGRRKVKGVVADGSVPNTHSPSTTPTETRSTPGLSDTPNEYQWVE